MSSETNYVKNTVRKKLILFGHMLTNGLASNTVNGLNITMN